MDLIISKDTPVGPHQRRWQFCIGSGHAGLAMRTDYVEQLRKIREELGVARVRFHGIFCDDLHTLHHLGEILPLPGAKRFTERSFRLCGLVFDNILACGMQPFVELGFMPKLLAKKKRKGVFYYKPFISMPESDGAWRDYIQAFIRYLLERYGEDEVSQWFFEVWNEPDLRIAFFAGTQNDYFHLYEITARAIKDICPKLKVGGPATSGSKWVQAFMAFCRENKTPVDFVTTHQYAGDPLGGVKDQGGPVDKEDRGTPQIRIGKVLTALRRAAGTTVLDGLRALMGDPSETSEIADDTFPKSAAIVKRQADGLPVYYTEWNECAAFSAYTNDTRKVAAYDVKMALMLDPVIDGSSIWCFSDIFEELHPFPEEFHGGFGMLTQHGIPKPVYYAMRMLARAGDERFELPGALEGEIGVAAFRGANEIQVILLRQKLKSAVLPKEKATVRVALDKAPSSVVLQRIDENHCNPLRVWEAMGRPLDMTPQQVSAIIDASKPVDEAIETGYQNGLLEIETELGVNDIHCIRIVL